MTPQERQLIDDLFDRLSKLEGSPRDAGAEAAIRDGLRRAPNATYALVQTVLVQDEALKRANAHIEELEAQGAGQQQSGSFLDTMRDAVFGQGQPPRGSVPNVRAPDVGGRPVWNTGQAMPQGYGQAPGQGGPGYGQPYGGQQPPPMPGGGAGGSFLGTAAAAAAGVVGGSLLLGSIRSMMGGGGQHQSFGDAGGLGGSSGGGKPWSDQSGSTLARDAGVDDIGSSGRGGDRDYGSRQGMFEQASNEDYDDDDVDHDSDDFDGDGDNDSDYA
jgi:uncharacterized protein